jgi:hypothetical protein
MVERIGLVCEWFGLQPPPLEYEDGALLWTDALHDWVMREEVSIDWLFSGDSKVHAAVYRNEMQFRRLLREMSEPMLRDLRACILLNRDHGMPLNDALEEFKRRCIEKGEISAAAAQAL